MIKKLRLFNFKAFEDTGSLDLRPITVLAGPNSGGKSSVLQSLLLLKQTLAGRPEINLNLDGQYLQFSDFSELVFGRPSLSKSAITYQFLIESPMPREYVPRYFSNPPPFDGDEDATLRSDIEMTFRYRRQELRDSAILDQFKIESRLGELRGPFFRASYRDGRYKASMAGKNVRRRLASFKGQRIDTVHGRHFLPQFLVLEADGDSDYRQHLTLDAIFRNPLNRLREELEVQLGYLGPLRQRPQRAYLHSGNPTIDIGESGEYAAQVLWRERNRKISYSTGIGEDPQETTLLEAVNDAFARIGMLQPVTVKSERSVMYQILFLLEGSRTKQTTTIADVGFGVSQLLPILVIGLRLGKESLLMLEQPEIHLHPRLQANLADFLLTLATNGRRIIIETHSDHFINRLRRRIAEDSTNQLQDSVSILFVNPPVEGRGAKVEPLQIDKYGVIRNWPPGFLPEAADEAQAIFLAGMNKRGL